MKTYCGNKKDLLSVTQDYVQDEAAQKIAKEHNMDYYKTSALTGEAIEEMINSTIQKVYELRLKPKIEEERQNEAKASANIVLG